MLINSNLKPTKMDDTKMNVQPNLNYSFPKMILMIDSGQSINSSSR